LIFVFELYVVAFHPPPFILVEVRRL